MEKTSFGREGEALARSYLENKGYRFLSANFRTAHSEIDLIMDDGGVLVFVEVKSRHNRRYGEPVEAVNPFKQRHIRLGARAYVLKGISQTGVSGSMWWKLWYRGKASPVSGTPGMHSDILSLWREIICMQKFLEQRPSA